MFLWKQCVVTALQNSLSYKWILGYAKNYAET